MRRLAWLVLVLLTLSAPGACADELRPAFLDIKEIAANEFAIRWKVPARGEMRLGLYVRLPAACKAASEPLTGFEAGSYFESFRIICPDGLKGETIAVDGLQATTTDALARIEYRGGATQIVRLNAEQTAFVVTGAQPWHEVARTYILLGVEHILASADHLLFVLALIFLVGDPWTLVKTVTAFTIAHSVTLAGATLGLFSLPQAPVEATIALSIVFLAREMVLTGRDPQRLSARRPWLVAFTFGLLHGFGFAGALKEVGLPQIDVPIALLTFNIGVELGQLIFIAGVLLTQRLARALISAPAQNARFAAGYAIGVAATFWTAERIASFWN